MKIQLGHNFASIVSMDNLLEAWKEFVIRKRNKKDVQEFSFHLMDNIISLHCGLNNHTYCHGGYQAFNISDPKPRSIHKALNRFRSFAYKVNKNNTKTCWILKCDIRKFFASVDHKILSDILDSYIPDKQIV